MEKEEAIVKGFTFELYWNGKLWKYQCPVCFNLHTEGHTPACSRGRLLTKRAPDALRAYDMGEVAGVKLTYVKGNVFATPAKRR